MKKNQYSVSIVMGLLMGAVVALFVGNMTTAILAGVVTAGVTAWVGSLQWGGEARKFATEVAKKVRVVEMMDVFIFTKNMILEIKTCISQLAMQTSQLIIRTLLAIRKMVVILATDVEARKAILAIFTVISIVVLNFLLIFSLGMNAAFLPVTIQAVYAFVVTIQAVCAFVFVCTLVLIGITSGAILDCAFSPSDKSDSLFNWVFNWFFQMILDDRGALTATAYMLYIRTGNALRIIAYPLILIPWGFIALANNKTGIAALSAMVLSGAHLSIAYFVGGIDAGNINFWLSLAIAMMAGAAAGKKIYDIKKESLEIPPLPAIKFRNQAEQVVG